MMILVTPTTPVGAHVHLYFVGPRAVEDGVLGHLLSRGRPWSGRARGSSSAHRTGHVL